MKRKPVVLICTAVVFALLLLAGGHSSIAWRVSVLEMKLSGQLDGLPWTEVISGLKGAEPLRFGSTTAFTGLRGLTSGLVQLNHLEDSDSCPALWDTPAGPIWGRFSDEGSLEALFIEQLLLQIYQNDIVNVSPGDFVLDVGSHLGTFTKLALQNGASAVVAFEPDPTNIACFRRTFHRELDQGRVLLQEAAVWDETGTISFTSSHDAGASTAKAASDGDIEVAAVTIDRAVEELGLGRVDFIKMDIEGAERRALNGATQTLDEHAPRMALSTYHLPDDPQVIAQLVFEAQPAYQVVSTIGFAYFFGDLGRNDSRTLAERSLISLNRAGEKEFLSEDRGPYSFPRLSPDGTRLAVVTGAGDRGLFVLSLLDGTKTRLMTETGLSCSPVWSPDGSQLAFSARYDGGNFNIYRKSVDGDGEAERLTDSRSMQLVESWSPDGKTLAFSQLDPRSGSDIWILSLEEGIEKRAFFSTLYHEGWPRFSPDGRWLAYTSNENGYLSVYVCPYPGPGKRLQVSTREGWYPRWGQGGQELFYRTGSRVMAVPISVDGDEISAGEPAELFDGEYALGFHLEGGAWDVSSSGERFVMLIDEISTRFQWTQRPK